MGYDRIVANLDREEFFDPGDFDTTTSAFLALWRMMSYDWSSDRVQVIGEGHERYERIVGIEGLPWKDVFPEVLEHVTGDTSDRGSDLHLSPETAAELLKKWRKRQRELEEDCVESVEEKHGPLDWVYDARGPNAEIAGCAVGMQAKNGEQLSGKGTTKLEALRDLQAARERSAAKASAEAHFQRARTPPEAERLEGGLAWRCPPDPVEGSWQGRLLCTQGARGETVAGRILVTLVLELDVHSIECLRNRRVKRVRVLAYDTSSLFGIKLIGEFVVVRSQALDHDVGTITVRAERSVADALMRLPRSPDHKFHRLRFDPVGAEH